MAQEESRKISERVLAGQKISRQNGVLYGSGNIIGYDRDKVNRTYVINEEQAATIRMVFTLYSQGYGEKAIVNELSRLGRKDGRGNVSWSCTKISRILRNATYMGYVCYNKSKVNNYLEKKRINNPDETSFVYVKGNFEPIVSEALWHECERIRKSRISSLRLPDGEARRKGARTTKNLWVSKLRCRCGSSYRIFNWRKLKDGTPVFEEERIDLMAVSEKPILTFTIDFETAKRYRKANKMPHQFRRAAWTDLTVDVYL